MTGTGANFGTTLRGPRRRWLLDWTGCLIVMAGATVAGFAFVFRHDVWLWAVAGVLIISGAAVWITAGPGAASRRGQPDPARDG